ncbi:MAG TPA: hypothetical protein VK997_14235 [Deferrisomatales bacterium]|nr:hypothetical protein [Deferrisomatales bacterium]
MRTRMGVVALLVVILGAGAVPPADSEVGGDDGVRAASDAGSAVQRRAQERRQERRGERQWITVPELSLTEALPLVGAPGVVIIDTTCRERAEAFPDRIPGAVWQDWTQVEQWAHRYKDAKTVLVYCA